MFLQCMESSVHNGGGKLDPPLASLTETEIQIKAEFQATSADVSKAKRKFPWSKKEVLNAHYTRKFKRDQAKKLVK